MRLSAPTQMRLSRLLRPDPFSSALARLIAATFSDDAFTLVAVENDGLRSRLLERAEVELANLHCRIVRASAKPDDELSLHDLLQQLSRQVTAGDTHRDALERIHRLLTEPGADCNRVVLLIDHAQRLSSSALRFLQLTSRSGPVLKIVLTCGTPAGAEFGAPELRVLQAGSTCIRIGGDA
jgi:hypothetical protein